MDLLHFYNLVESDHAAVEVLQKLDQQLIGTYSETLTRLFREVIAQEHRNPRQFEALKTAYAAAARGAMRYLDDSDVTSTVAKFAPHLLHVSFAQSAALLTYESAYLFRLGVPHSKIAPFWTWVDARKADFIKHMERPDFKMELLVDPAVASFGKETGGEEWKHLSPGFWMKLACVGLAAANVLAEVPTAGLATASVFAAGVGVWAL